MSSGERNRAGRRGLYFICSIKNLYTGRRIKLGIYLKADRLIVRNFRAEDWQDLYDYLSLAEVLTYEPDEVSDEAECRELALKRAGGDRFLAVELKGKMIGHLYFAPTGPAEFGTWELGYIFNPKFYGCGYATEACRALIGHAFAEKEAHRVVAMCNPENSASWRLLERLGMRREGHHVQKAFFRRDANGQPIWHDAYTYAVLAREWQTAMAGRLLT